MAGIYFNHPPYDNPPPSAYANGPFAVHRPFMPSFDGTNEPEQQPQTAPPPLTGDPSFDILEWHPAYQSCQRFFLDHAQHEPATQALCALINIRLPFQCLENPITSSTPSQSSQAGSSNSTNFNFSFPNPRPNNSPNHGSRSNSNTQQPPFISLIPYIRRLIVTGFDKNPILHGFFGDDYTRGVLPHVDCERRNYLFAAKHGGWRSCKRQYDIGSGRGEDEGVPFMKPLDEAKIEELVAAEKAWSGWLAMEDWMVGPRAPDDEEGLEARRAAAAAPFGVQAQAQAGASSREMERHRDTLPNGVAESVE